MGDCAEPQRTGTTRDRGVVRIARLSETRISGGEKPADTPPFVRCKGYVFLCNDEAKRLNTLAARAWLFGLEVSVSKSDREQCVHVRSLGEGGECLLCFGW